MSNMTQKIQPVVTWGVLILVLIPAIWSVGKKTMAYVQKPKGTGGA